MFGVAVITVDDAIEYFHQAIDLDPDFAEAYNESVFQAMKAEYEAEMAMQLAQVREWEAAGELETVSFR